MVGAFLLEVGEKMIKINGKSYKEIIVMDRKNNVIAIINDKGKIVENNGIKVVFVANKN